MLHFLKFFHTFCAAKNVLKSSLALSKRGVIHDRGEVGHETEVVVENLTRRCGDVSAELLCCLSDREVFRTLLKGKISVSLSNKEPKLTGSCTSLPLPRLHLIISTGKSKYNRLFSRARPVVEARHEPHSKFSNEASKETVEFEKDDALVIFFLFTEEISLLFGDLTCFCFPKPGRDKQKALHLKSSSLASQMKFFTGYLAFPTEIMDSWEPSFFRGFIIGSVRTGSGTALSLGGDITSGKTILKLSSFGDGRERTGESWFFTKTLKVGLGLSPGKTLRRCHSSLLHLLVRPSSNTINAGGDMRNVEI